MIYGNKDNKIQMSREAVNEKRAGEKQIQKRQ